MSDPWINGGNRLLDALGGNLALRDEVRNGYRRLLANVGPDGSVTYKELNGLGYVIGTYNPQINEMRDKLKDRTHFEGWISKFYDSIDSILKWIENGKTAEERIPFMKRSAVDDYLNIIKCKYSAGYDPVDFKMDLKNAVHLAYQSWTDNSLKVYYRKRYLNQYILDAYDQMVWMLSLGYLLNIEETDFIKLVEIIDRDKVEDFLLEFIINAKLKNRQAIIEESYEFNWVLFGKIRQAIVEEDKSRAEKLIKEFIDKDWYNEHKDCGWHNSHKSKNYTYFGYWSFETAAIVKILALDDSSFMTSKYYPRDLVLRR